MTRFFGEPLRDVDVFPRVRPRRWPRPRAAALAAVFAGGFVGGLTRYGVTSAWPAPAYQFPWATLVVNTSGAFALALLLVLVVDVLPPTTVLRPALGTGFLGAFTTFASVVTAADRLAALGRVHTAAIYLLASAVAGLSAAAFGLVLGRGIAAYRHRGTEQGGGDATARAGAAAHDLHR